MGTAVEIVQGQGTPSQRARDVLRQLYRLIERQNGHPPALGEFFPVPVETVVTKVLGWHLELVDIVGAQFDNNGEFVGPNHGESDPAAQRILVSMRQRGEAEKRFTIAHEIGHAVLHAHKVTPANRTRSVRPVERRAAMSPQPLQQRLEREADVFAAALLMPEKAVRTQFKQLFGVDRVLAQSMEIANGEGTLRPARHTLRDHATELAKRRVSAETKSLAEFFGVSIAAMAIRICELRLIQ